MINKEISVDKEEIKARFYQVWYTEDQQWRRKASFENLNSITQAEKSGLQRTFEEEVRTAINSCTPDKSFGYDGYTTAFY